MSWPNTPKVKATQKKSPMKRKHHLLWWSITESVESVDRQFYVGHLSNHRSKQIHSNWPSSKLFSNVTAIWAACGADADHQDPKTFWKLAENLQVSTDTSFSKRRGKICFISYDAADSSNKRCRVRFIGDKWTLELEISTQAQLRERLPLIRFQPIGWWIEN